MAATTTTPMTKTKKVTDPRILIIDYYDLLINSIDIYTEETLIELAKIQATPAIVTPKTCCDKLNHGHYEQMRRRHEHFCYEDDGEFMCSRHSHLASSHQAQQQHQQRHRKGVDADYLNKARMKAIVEIKKVQEESLKLYKLNSAKIDAEYKRLKLENPDQDEEELLRQVIFAKKFAFVVIIDGNKFKFKFEAFTIFCDFYINENNVKYLEQLLNDNKKPKDKPTELKDKSTEFSNVFNQKLVLATESHKAIQKKIEPNGDEIILHLRKSEVLSMKFLSYQNVSIKRVERAALPTLKCFAICHHTIEYMAPDAFDGMHDLESLFLFSNKLQLGPEHSNIFKTLTGCRKLNLSFNEIAYLHPNALENMYNLQDLNMSSNRIVFNDENSCLFENLKIVHSLNIGYNTLEKLTPVYFKNNSLLKCLVLRGCSMVEIEENSFDNLKILKQLDLTSNKLVTFPKNLFAKTTNLEDLNFLNNEIIDFDDEFFDNMANLKVLWISSNKLTTIKATWFSQVTELKELCLGNNSLEVIEPNSFDWLVNLEKLDLSYNLKLGDVINGSKLFMNLTALKMLTLDQMEIMKIEDDLFHGLDNLEKLSLARNKIERLNVNALRCLPNLKTLVLDQNLLSEVPLNVLTILPNIQRISLSNNPFSTDYHDKLRENSRVFYIENPTR